MTAYQTDLTSKYHHLVSFEILPFITSLNINVSKATICFNTWNCIYAECLQEILLCFRSLQGDYITSRIPTNLNFTSGTSEIKGMTAMADTTNYSGELVREYHKSKQKLQEALASREKERNDLIRQINGENNRYNEER